MSVLDRIRADRTARFIKSPALSDPKPKSAMIALEHTQDSLGRYPKLHSQAESLDLDAALDHSRRWTGSGLCGIALM